MYQYNTDYYDCLDQRIIFTNLERFSRTSPRWLDIVDPDDTEYEFWTVKQHIDYQYYTYCEDLGIEREMNDHPTTITLVFNDGKWVKYAAFSCTWNVSDMIEVPKYVSCILDDLRTSVITVENSNLWFGIFGLVDILGRDVCSIIRSFKSI